MDIYLVVSPRLAGAIETFFDLADWEGLWLSGGTCLAEYWFGHRISVDIDLFTADDALFDAARDVLRRPDALDPLGTLESVRTDLHHTQFLLRCAGEETVKVDLVRDLPIVLGPREKVGNVWLESLPDLVSNKMGCLIHREDVKDYVDLYFLLPHLGLTAGEAVELGLRREAGLDPVLLAEQMRFVQAHSRPDFLRTDVPWRNIQQFFVRFREEVLRLVEPRG